MIVLWSLLWHSPSADLLSQRRGGGGLWSGSVKSQKKNWGKLRCRHQTSRSLKELHLCTGDTKGTNEHARGTSRKK